MPDDPFGSWGTIVRNLVCIGLALCLALSACAGLTIKDKMPAYVGQPISALIAKLGYPTRQDAVAGRTVYAWSNNRFVEGTSYGCTIRAIVDSSDTITSWDFVGNEGGCGMYAQMLR